MSEPPFNKVIGVTCNFIKKRLCYRCFPVNFTKFLRTPFLQSSSGRLLLNLPLFLKQSLNNSILSVPIPNCSITYLYGYLFNLILFPESNFEHFFYVVAFVNCLSDKILLTYLRSRVMVPDARRFFQYFLPKD